MLKNDWFSMLQVYIDISYKQLQNKESKICGTAKILRNI